MMHGWPLKCMFYPQNRVVHIDLQCAIMRFLDLVPRSMKIFAPDRLVLPRNERFYCTSVCTPFFRLPQMDAAVETNCASFFHLLILPPVRHFTYAWAKSTFIAFAPGQTCHLHCDMSATHYDISETPGTLPQIVRMGCQQLVTYRSLTGHLSATETDCWRR